MDLYSLAEQQNWLQQQPMRAAAAPPKRRARPEYSPPHSGRFAYPEAESILHQRHEGKGKRRHGSSNAPASWSIHVSEVSVPRLQRLIKKLERNRAGHGKQRNPHQRIVKSLKMLVFLCSRLSEAVIRQSLLLRPLFQNH